LRASLSRVLSTEACEPIDRIVGHGFWRAPLVSSPNAPPARVVALSTSTGDARR
jgi:hypothetical protein